MFDGQLTKAFSKLLEIFETYSRTHPLRRFENKKSHSHSNHNKRKMGQYYIPCIVVIKDGIAVVVAWLDPFRFGNGMKQMEHSYLGNNFVAAFEWLISPEGPHHKGQVVWAGDYGGIEEGYDENLFSLCYDGQNHPNIPKSLQYYPLIVNHTKRVYINKDEVEGRIHPLPLLTTETEGGGGGDYRGINANLLGIWARDVISVENEAPEGFEKVAFHFEE